MDTLNKDDFINVYVLRTLNEIKASVRFNIKLDKDREEVADTKMAAVLTDLINANFKNLQKDPEGNIIYTLLPIVDEKENRKVRTSLVLYYAALYYDNVDLLQDLMKADISFYAYYDNLNLCYLDKTISSKFERKEYIKLLNECGFVFRSFHKSIEDLSPEEREKYILRFKTLLESKHEAIVKARKRGSDYSVEKIFSKNRLDVFSDETYRQASCEQLRMIDEYNDKEISDGSRDRLNKLMQTKGFSNRLFDYDLMLKILSDEQLEVIKYFASKAISIHYDKNESPSKILDFISRRPDLAFEISRVPKEKFKEMDIDTLIEICDYSDKHVLNLYLSGSEECDELAKKVRPKVVIKRVLGRYKKTNK